jgi:hypothetical protein
MVSVCDTLSVGLSTSRQDPHDSSGSQDLSPSRWSTETCCVLPPLPRH